MKKLYEAENGLEAHMIVNLLEQAQLDARVDGDLLQGAVGEIQVSGIVRIMVAEGDYDAALEIIKQWEAKNPELDTDTKEKLPKSNALNNIAYLVLGVMLGIGVTYYINYVPTYYDGLDHNSDGIRDVTWVYKNDRITKSKVDRNFDGEVDYIAYYDRFGNSVKSVADDNFDGKFETKMKYQNGSLTHHEQDTTGDGFHDLYSVFKSGVIVKSYFLSPETNKVIKEQYFYLDRLIKEKVDSNSDGVLDTINEYDEIENLIRSYEK